MKSGSLTSEICKGYCQYYKPSKDEEIACMGFIIAERLVEWGLPISSPVISGPLSNKGETEMPGEETTVLLRNQICTVCPFYEDDCDFIGFHRLNAPDAQQVKAMPCGGFLFLGRFIDSKIIDIRDINQVI